jgi:ABC-2 type transport system ATP-binding protein
MENVIEITSVQKVYRIYKKKNGLKNVFKNIVHPDYKDFVAVDDMSFNIHKGDIVGYIGPNGAGKSTTIKMLTGILMPNSGTIKVFGKDPLKYRKENSKQIGVVFGQKSQLWWDIPAIESLELLKEIYKVSDSAFRERVEKYADMLQVKEFLNLPVRQMSLGQRMKCDLIAALIHDPSILFLDEPTIGLDVATKDRLREFILELNKTKKVTVFLTTHDMQDVETLCNRVILINHGRMLYDGDLESVKEKYIQYRNLKVVFNKVYTIQQLEFLKSFKNIRIQSLDEKTMIIQYNYKLYSVTDIVSCLMKNTEIADFSIKDLEIENVIKEVS